MKKTDNTEWLTCEDCGWDFAIWEAVIRNDICIYCPECDSDNVNTSKQETKQMMLLDIFGLLYWLGTGCWLVSINPLVVMCY